MTYAIRLHRLAVHKPWAGNALPRIFPAMAGQWPSGTGESIEVSDLPGERTLIANGEWREKSLTEAMAEHRLSLLGQLAGADELPDFPLCIKLLDTREPMSVQDHPSDEFQRGRRVRRGKSEGWLVLKAEPGAIIYQGLKPNLSRADFEDALRNNRTAEALNARGVNAGDWLHNPAGMVHAIGGGLVLLEIQQNCGVTYRLWDFPRPGGPWRAVHLRDGLDAAKFDIPLPEIAPTGGDTRLHDAGPFGAWLLRPRQPRKISRTWAGFTLVTCIEGSIEVTAHAGNRLEPAVLHAPDTVLFPSDFWDFELYPEGDCGVVLSWARAS